VALRAHLRPWGLFDEGGTFSKMNAHGKSNMQPAYRNAPQAETSQL